MASPRWCLPSRPPTASRSSCLTARGARPAVRSAPKWPSCSLPPSSDAEARRTSTPQGSRSRTSRQRTCAPGSETTSAIRAALLVAGPWRHDAGHACIGNKLAHVLVGVNNDTEIHAVHVGVAVVDVNLALKVLWRDGQVGLLDGFKRALQPVDYLCLRSYALLDVEPRRRLTR